MVKHRIRDSIHQMSKVYITRWMLFLLLKPRNVIWSGNDICSFQQTEESLLMSFSKQNLCVGLDTFWTISGRLGGEKRGVISLQLACQIPLFAQTKGGFLLSMSRVRRTDRLWVWSCDPMTGILSCCEKM